MDFLIVTCTHEKKKKRLMIDKSKALLLNEYLKEKFIKVLDKKGNFEILSKNKIVINSILKA